jgi:ribosomal protein S18 acetylase RimI-like enzyme
MQPTAYRVRPATPEDVSSLVRLKHLLARSEQAEAAVRATAQDWLRNGFGSNARFSAFVAECAGEVVGMITYSERYYTGWPEPAIYVADMFVEERHRCRGIGRSLLAEVGAFARSRGSPMLELTVRNDNAAREFYRRCGFQLVEECLNYVAGCQTAA